MGFCLLLSVPAELAVSRDPCPAYEVTGLEGLAVSIGDTCDTSVGARVEGQVPRGRWEGQNPPRVLVLLPFLPPCTHFPCGLAMAVLEDFPSAAHALGNQRRKVGVLYSHHI